MKKDHRSVNVYFNEQLSAIPTENKTSTITITEGLTQELSNEHKPELCFYLRQVEVSTGN